MIFRARYDLFFDSIDSDCPFRSIGVGTKIKLCEVYPISAL